MNERTSPAFPWSTHAFRRTVWEEHLLDSTEAGGGLLQSDRWRKECHWVLTDYSQQAQCHEPHHITQHIWCRILIRSNHRLSSVHGRLFSFLEKAGWFSESNMCSCAYGWSSIYRLSQICMKKYSYNFQGWFRWFSSCVFGILDNTKLLSLACKWEIMYSGRNNEASHHNCKQIGKLWKLCSFINLVPNYY